MDAHSCPHIGIRPLVAIDADVLVLLQSGYVSDARYEIAREETDAGVTISMKLAPLVTPHRKQFPPPDSESLERYRRMVPGEFCLGAYDGETLVGIALAEAQEWNRSLWVWEFHVGEGRKGRGIGTMLMEELARRARAAGLRIMVSETQNTNVPAIRFYRRMGFNVEGLDLSYYTNDDWPVGEVAVFMKRKLQRADREGTMTEDSSDQPRYFDDDGTELNPDSLSKPSLCLSCAKDDDPNERILCNLNRLDQEGEAPFECGAYAPKRR